MDRIWKKHCDQLRRRLYDLLQKGIPMRNRDGFTLLELVAALSLSVVIGIWVAGFFGSQMHEYKKQTQILKTEELADRVCFQITSRLDHAFLFRVDPKESSVLYYWDPVN